MSSFNCSEAFDVRLATESCVGNPLTICGSGFPSLVGRNEPASPRFERLPVNRQHGRGNLHKMFNFIILTNFLSPAGHALLGISGQIIAHQVQLLLVV